MIPFTQFKVGSQTPRMSTDGHSGSKRLPPIAPHGPPKPTPITQGKDLGDSMHHRNTLSSSFLGISPWDIRTSPTCFLQLSIFPPALHHPCSSHRCREALLQHRNHSESLGQPQTTVLSSNESLHTLVGDAKSRLRARYPAPASARRGCAEAVGSAWSP